MERAARLNSIEMWRHDSCHVKVKRGGRAPPEAGGAPGRGRSGIKEEGCTKSSFLLNASENPCKKGLEKTGRVTEEAESSGGRGGSQIGRCTFRQGQWRRIEYSVKT